MKRSPQGADPRFPISLGLAGGGSAMFGASLLLAALWARFTPDASLSSLVDVDREVIWDAACFVLTMGGLGSLTAPALAGVGERDADG